MNVLLVAEGKHERGDPFHKIVGALEELVKRLLVLQDPARSINIEVAPANDKKVRVHPGKGSGLEKRALAWMKHAGKKRCDALILLIDQDGDKTRASQLSKAQADQRVNAIPRALGVAVKSFDAWMLADETALSNVLGCPINTQKAPETIADPKRQCETLRDQSPASIDLTDMYRDIAQSTDIDKLKKRCPAGFKSFAERVEKL